MSTVSTDKPAILASLTRSLNVAEGRPEDSDNGDVTTPAGDLIAGVRDYVESTQDCITGTALAEVAYAWLAGARYADPLPDKAAYRAAYGAVRTAGMNL